MGFLVGRTNTTPYPFFKSAETVESARVAGIFEVRRCEHRGVKSAQAIEEEGVVNSAEFSREGKECGNV